MLNFIYRKLIIHEGIVKGMQASSVRCCHAPSEEQVEGVGEEGGLRCHDAR